MTDQQRIIHTSLIVPPAMAIALSYLGEHEIGGDNDNQHVVAWLTAVGIQHATDEIPWCSAFVNACHREAGIAGTGKANARSWEHWGVALAKPEFGCVVVFNRPPEPANGHVAFYVGETHDSVWCLGGNQGNEVSIAKYPKTRLLGYRTAP